MNQLDTSPRQDIWRKIWERKEKDRETHKIKKDKKENTKRERDRKRNSH